MATKIKTRFFCQECGYETAKWLGQCPGCKAWNSLVEEPVSVSAGGKEKKQVLSGVQSAPAVLNEISMEEERRTETGMGELDRVLGGGIVTGSLTLVGGATARIGDPSGKDKLRPFLSEETLAHNIEGLKKSFGKFLKFGDGRNDAVMVDNWDWFKDINYLSFLRDIGTYYSVNRMLTMDSVKSRLDREQPMSFLEFNYMLLQGYDFCELYRKYGCRAQIAGSDQWGNITSGTELGRRKYDVELFGFTSPIITDSAGRKMGKSEGNAVWINEDKLPAYDYYQYFRNIGDAEVGKCLRIYTDLPMDEIRRLEDLKDQEINEAKKILAFEATKICRGFDEAKAAEETAVKTFEQGGIGGELPTLEKDNITGLSVLDAFVEIGFCASKGEVRRLIKQNGIRVNDRAISDENYVFDESDIVDGQIKIAQGKKKFGLIKQAG